MTWVGFVVVFFCLLSYVGSVLQWKGSKAITPPHVRKGFRFGIFLALVLTTIVLWGTLAIGTGHL